MRLYHCVKNERTGIFGCRSTLDAVQYLHKHDIVHRDLKYVFCFYNLDPAANNADPRIFCTGRENQTAMSLSLTLACKFSKENCFIDELNLTCQFRAKHLHSADEQLHSLAGSFGYVAPEVLLKQGHGKPVDIWSTGYFNLHFFRSVSNLSGQGSSPMSFFADTPLFVLMMSKYLSRKLQQLKLNFTIDIGRTYQRKVCLFIFYSIIG